MAHIGYDFNDYGTMVSVHKCDTCGDEFTVCPAVHPLITGWENCLFPSCPSYDSGRDVDKLLEDGGEILEDKGVGPV